MLSVHIYTKVITTVRCYVLHSLNNYKFGPLARVIDPIITRYQKELWRLTKYPVISAISYSSLKAKE